MAHLSPRYQKLIATYKLREPVNVTKTHLPELALYQDYLKEIWPTQWVTNHGQLHQQLEKRLREYLAVPAVSLFCNGTLALLVAVKALQITGEVITTPFTFPATVNVLLWQNITPVFCDVEPNTYNIDISKLEPLITPRTSAILAVHVYGLPCDVEGLAKLAKKYNLKLIYDAAHAFSVKIDDRSIAQFGDISAFSFHATKLFHTVEGGALVGYDLGLKRQFDILGNFGIVDKETVVSAGINAKLNELQAAMGLLELDYLALEIQKRRSIYHIYHDTLESLNGIKLPTIPSNVSYNYSYYPLLFTQQSPISRESMYELLKEFNIYTRKYFYPLCSNFPFVANLSSAHPKKLSIAHNIANNILCLPIYGELGEQQASSIAKVFRLIHQTACDN